MAVEPYTVAAFVVSTSAIVTASATVGAAKWIRDVRAEVSRNSRVLHGEDDIEEWGGLVKMVHEHRTALRRNEEFEPVRADGGKKRDD
jgi:hypothetical protein